MRTDCEHFPDLWAIRAQNVPLDVHRYAMDCTTQYQPLGIDLSPVPPSHLGRVSF